MDRGSVFSDEEAEDDDQYVHVSRKAAETFGIPSLDAAVEAHRREQESEDLSYFQAMGLNTDAVEDCRNRHPDAVSNKNPCKHAAPHRRPTKMYVDGEEFSYTISPERTPDTDSAKQAFADWLKHCIHDWGPTCDTLIIGFDQRSRGSFCIPKQVHTGDLRAKRRSKKVAEEQDAYEELRDEIREGVVARGDCETDEEVEAQVGAIVAKRVVKRMVVDRGNHPLPTYWHSYMAAREGRWALYQLMVWTILDPKYFTLPVGKTMCFMGLPVLDAPFRVTFDDRVVHGVLPVTGEITQEMADADPELFSRCLMARGHQEYGKAPVTIFLHWDEWDVKMWEADYLIVHFYKFLPGQNWLVRSNDRDMLLTLLAHSIDRRNHNRPGFQGSMFLMCPNKSGNNTRKKFKSAAATTSAPAARPKAKKKTSTWVGDYFFDIDRLYDDIDNDTQLSGFIYNRVLTYIFVMLLTGCDHIRKDMFFGLNPVDNVLNCLYTYHERYQHMVQLSHTLIPDPSALRFPLVDERAAIEYVSRCYLLKYSGVVLSKRQKEHEKLVKRRQREYTRAHKKWEKECEKLHKQRARYAKKHNYDSAQDAVLMGMEFPSEMSRFPVEPVLVATPPMDKRVSRDDVRAHVRLGVSAEEVKAKKALPTREVIRRDVRHAEWAIYYLILAGRDQSVFEPGGILDPLALAEDGVTPYWGYEPDPTRPGKYRMSEFVYEKQDLRTLKFPQSYLVNLFDKHRERKLREQRQRQQDARDAQTKEEFQADQRRKKAVGQKLLAAYGKFDEAAPVGTVF